MFPIESQAHYEETRLRLRALGAALNHIRFAHGTATGSRLIGHLTDGDIESIVGPLDDAMVNINFKRKEIGEALSKFEADAAYGEQALASAP